MIAGSEWLLIGTVAAVGVLHTVVPDHWVPITLIARQQGWTKREVARAALIAGTGHTVSTLLIGLAVWVAGIAFATKFGNLVSLISSVALIAFGGWIAISSLRELRSGASHGHSHSHGHQHGPTVGFHGSDLARITTGHDMLDLSIYETGQPPHFRLSGHSGDRVWLETHRDGGAAQRFDFINRGDYWQSFEEVPEPHAFAVTVSVAHGDHVHSYKTAFEEHSHDPQEHNYVSDDTLYVPSSVGATVQTTHTHAHRHGRGNVHMHVHDHGVDTWHRDNEIAADDPPAHDHRHRRSFRTTLLLILGSSPMVEGIPAFFAASKYGAGLIAVMAVIFAIATILTYVLLCVTSAAGLQRISLGPLERYGEVLSGAFIAVVGLVFLAFPIV